MTLGLQFPTILSAAQAGTEWALSELYRDLQPRLLRYLRAQDPNNAEDLASEVWLDLAAGLTRFDGDEPALRAWVFTIARRRVLDQRRSLARRRTEPVPVEALAGLNGSSDCEAEAFARISTQEALAHLASLPRVEAEVVLLRVLGGLDAEQVGAILGKRPGTTRVLQHRALARLARHDGHELVTQWAARAI
jgi:RNA polymerase sigma-70 factor (ECF subfamily)